MNSCLRQTGFAADVLFYVHSIVLQISDFGLSVLKEYTSLKSRNHHKLKGTVTHVAPELLRDIKHRVNEKTDIYSLAIFMWELLTQKSPFRGG